MRKLIAKLHDFSLDGLLSEEGTEYFQFCRDLPDDPVHLQRIHDFYQSASALIMGRTMYEGMARDFPMPADHPWADVLNPARKVVFSRTLTAASLPNTTIAAGDTAEEIAKLKRGGDGHIVVSGGVSFWRSLMRLDLIDGFYLTLFPYLAGEGTRLFDDVPKSYQLELVSSIANSNGTVDLEYQRHRPAR